MSHPISRNSMDIKHDAGRVAVQLPICDFTANTKGVSQSTLPDTNPLVDRYGRVHRAMRISVTDVCNIRCQYCMPEGDVHFLPRDRHLSFDQISRLVGAFAKWGIDKYRLTGGEPLLRENLFELVRSLKQIPGVQQIALTTNGMYLKKHLQSLVQAGVNKINISLDTLREKTFQQLSRRSGLDRVLEGIEAAIAEPKIQVRLNALVLREVNLNDVVELVKFSRSRNVTIRFIEFMPLDAQRAWNQERMVSGAELRDLLSARIGPLQLLDDISLSQPARDYAFADGTRVGFIDSVTQPFCNSCDRLRLTADGKLRNCLFGKQEWDLSQIFLESEIDNSEFDRKLGQIVRQCVLSKAAAHGIDAPEFQPPGRAMYQIGG